MITTPAMADLYNVAATTYVQGAFNALDSAKQNVIDSSHKLSADLVEDGTTNKVVTATEKATWNGKQDALTTAQQNAVDSGITAAKVSTYDGYATTIAGKQDAIDSTHKLSADLVDDSTSTNKFVTAAEKSQITTNQNAITTLNANDQTAGSVDYKIAQATSGMVTASSTTTFTNKTIDATGTGNSITNLGTSNFASGTVVDSTTGIAAAATASDSKLVTEKAVRTAIDTAATVTVTGSTQYGAVTDVTNAGGGIQVTKGDAKVQIKSSGTVTGSATIWIE